MRLIPPEIPLNLGSTAERRLHALLRDVELEGWVALHSIGLAEHEYKIVGEIDFLLVAPEGLLVLEVKGGRIRLEEGVWTYRDRWGVDHRSNEGPFKQAESATFALLARLRKLLPQGTLDSVPYSWGAVFPDITFPATAPDWVAAQVLDLEDMQSPAALRNALRHLGRHARERRTGRGARSRELSSEHLASLVRAIRPDFDRIPPLRRRADTLAEQTLALTEDQYRWLDASDDVERLLCTGGAGTGKTFLAVEAARREAAVGRTVTVTCRSPIVAAFIAAQPGMDHDSISVIPLSRLEADAQCQSLIVDEGQDLMNLEDIGLLENHLTDGLEGGRSRIFLDRNHQAGVLGNFDRDALEIVESFAQSRIHLPENCRNTSDIIEDVTRCLGVDMGRGGAGNGPIPVWDWWTDPLEAARDLGSHLTRLLDNGIEPNEITVLTGGPPEDDPVLNALVGSLSTPIEPLSGNSIHDPPQGRIGAVRIGLFKGLENDFVCVTDIPSLDENLHPEGVAELYVAMTRPRAGLRLELPRRLRDPIGRLAPAAD